MTECPVATGVEMPSGEVGPIQVRVSPGVCEGWGQCHRWAPDVYPLDEDGCVDVHLMEVPSELAEQATWGASACPVRAITIVGPPWTTGSSADVHPARYDAPERTGSIAAVIKTTRLIERRQR